MYCQNCGAKLKDDLYFCPKCGARTIAGTKEPVPEKKIIKKKKFNKKPVIIAAVAAGVVAVAVIAFFVIKNMQFKVSFDIGYASAQGNPETQIVKRGEYASAPHMENREGYLFVGWFENEGDTLPFIFNEPINSNKHLTALWYDENDTADADSDLLPDVLEAFYRTDPYNPDSDGDGVCDGIEVRLLGLDPNKKDTDNNFVSDYDEDLDGDGLVNGDEEKAGTNPLFADTDSDSLGDLDELSIYGTDPLRKDTDGDGVDDGRELILGSDPTVAETSFTTRDDYGTLSEHTPVKLEISAVTDAAGAGDIDIYEIPASENAMFSEAGIGFLGRAYDISTGGELESAQITFTYDPSLGTLGEYFQPRIYWYDEEADKLVEVPDQEVSEGRVSATVDHFSIYTLRNKSIVDILRDFVTGDFQKELEERNKDSNNDGISDYHTELLSVGRILYKDTTILRGVLDRYDPADDDWDDDGLKNGEEIQITGSDDRTKLKVISNPVDPDSDGDGIGDHAEVKQLGTSPLEYDFRSPGALHQLENDGKYSYSTFEADIGNKVALFLDWNKREQAEECLINYFSKYTPEDSFKQNETWLKRQETFDQLAKVSGIISNLVGVAGDLYDVVEDGTKLADLEDPYMESLQVQIDAQYVKNASSFSEEKADSVLGGMKMLTLPDTLEKIFNNLESDDAADQIEGLADIIAVGRNAISAYRKATEYEIFRFTKQLKNIQQDAKALDHSLTMDAGLALTITNDVADAFEKQMHIISTYSQIMANAEAINMHLDLLIYLRDNVGSDASDVVKNIRDWLPDDFKELSLDACIKCAAAELAADILDETGMEFYKDLADAMGRQLKFSAMETALDVCATFNPYAKIASVFKNLYKYTGMVELSEYTIYFTLMRYMSDGCKYLVDSKVSVHDQTFSCSVDDKLYVEKYMVQLAQIRIMGTYYVIEYCAQNTGASWCGAAWNIIKRTVTGKDVKNPTADDFRQIGRSAISDVYRQAGRLSLTLSKNLPYYGSFSHESDPDELEGVADLEELPESLDAFLDRFRIYRDAEGGKEFDADDIMGKSSTILNYMLFNVTCCDYSIYPGSAREEVIYSRGEFDDPKGWAESSASSYGMCYVYDLNTVKWAANNIFHISDDNFETLLESGEEENRFYASDGKIYYFTGGIGWESSHINIVNARLENDVYRIVYSIFMDGIFSYADDPTDYFDGLYYAEMKYEEIDGQKYWTMLKHSSQIPEDMQYEDWQWAYYQFIIKGEYWNMGQTYMMDIEDDYYLIECGLHDMDADMVPELLISSGGDYYAASTTYVYTYKDGEIKYLGLTFPYSGGYLDDKDYPGLIWDVAHTGYYAAYYIYIEDGELKEETIYQAEDDYNLKKQVETGRTDDERLYELYHNGSVKDIQMISALELRTDSGRWKDLVAGFE